MIDPRVSTDLKFFTVIFFFCNFEDVRARLTVIQVNNPSGIQATIIPIAKVKDEIKGNPIPILPKKKPIPKVIANSKNCY